MFVVMIMSRMVQTIEGVASVILGAFAEISAPPHLERRNELSDGLRPTMGTGDTRLTLGVFQALSR